MYCRSSHAETTEQNSDGEASESSEETSDLWTLYKSVRNYTTNLGLCLAEPFLRLPSKRSVHALSLRCTLNANGHFMHCHYGVR